MMTVAKPWMPEGPKTRIQVLCGFAGYFMSTYDNGRIKSCYGSSFVSTSLLLVNGFVANSFEYGYAEIGLPDLE